jgi:hypothetical protein
MMGCFLPLINGFAAEIREGARMHVKENSMWFHSSTELAVWQRFQQVSTPEVMKTYQEIVLDTREAWQFGNRLPVKIITYWPGEHEVEVKMLPVEAGLITAFGG